MARRSHSPTLAGTRWIAIVTAVALPGAAAADATPAAPSLADPFLQAFVADHCTDCHGVEEPEADLSLEDPDRLDLDAWERVLEQLATGEMPPRNKKRRRRPAPEAREKAIGRITAALEEAGRHPQPAWGPFPADGNRIDHDRLFDGARKPRRPAASPPRYWRRSQPQYDALMERLWVIPKLRYEKAAGRSDPEWAAFSYAQPFPSLDPIHFTNYSGGVHADEATLRALMSAGAQIAERLTADEPAYSKFHQPPHAVGIPSIRRGSRWERFKVEPPARPAEFEPFLSKKEGAPRPTADERRAAVDRVFQIVLNRPPTPGELGRYGGLLERSLAKGGAAAALRGLITAVFVSPEFVFRMELGLGPVDAHGRRHLSPDELVHAIGYALGDDGPDKALHEAAREGRLRGRADVEREVRRLLGDPAIEKHRRLRFFQEFFGYHRAGDVFKDEGGWHRQVNYLVRDADLLVEHVLARDRDVLAGLLTTDRYFVAYPVVRDPALFEAIIAHTAEETAAGVERSQERGREVKPGRNGIYNRQWAFTQGLALIPRTVHNDPSYHETAYIRIYGFDGATFSWTREQPIPAPGRRAGILTHPAWLVAHSGNFDNDVVRRGHWVRTHLLAGTVPDVPIDVEAQVPDEPESTLRHRLRVTREERCIRCHRRMDPLGFPFEIYDHYGRYREQEMVGARDNIPAPIDASGEIIGSGEPGLDGPVEDAVDLVHRLARSPRVRQSFVRHAFRYWMGRNETLDDAPVLRAADAAYVRGGGSFNELLVALLTSDAFLFRR